MLAIDVLYIKKDTNNQIEIDYFDSKNEPLLWLYEVMMRKMKVKFPPYSSLYIVFYENLTDDEKRRIKTEHGDGKEYYFKNRNISELNAKNDIEFMNESLQGIEEGITISKFNTYLSREDLIKINHYIHSQDFVYSMEIDKKVNKNRKFKAMLKGKLTSRNLNVFLEIIDIKNKHVLFNDLVFKLPQSSAFATGRKSNVLQLYGDKLYWENEFAIDVIINMVGDRLRTKVYHKKDGSTVIQQQHIKYLKQILR